MTQKRRTRRSIEIVQVRGERSRSARQFIRFPHRLFRGCPQWVPWFDRSMRGIVGKRHPFFDHSDAEFFLAVRDGRTVGRIAAFENTRFNEKHGERACNFYFFDAEDDREISHRLFECASEWALDRGLDTMVGPMLFGAASGQGILIEGFEHRASMTMMGYHYPYYRTHLEGEGFEKRRDYVSAQTDPRTYELPDRIRRAAEITLKRGRFSVLRFANRRELKSVAERVGSLYNEVLASFNEGHRLTDREMEAAIDDLLLVADPELVKILTYDNDIVGFLLAFPDLSAAMQRSHGRMSPVALIRLKREFSRSRRLIINGMGILPEYQRLGGNALLYSELARTSEEQAGRFVHAEMTQIAETTHLMLKDMGNLGGEVYKIHRLYQKPLT